MPAVAPRFLKPALLLLPALLLGGCPEPRMGPDIKMGMMALAECRYDQALLMADAALARGDAQTRLRALLLKAATLRDRGDQAGLAALTPTIDAAWQTARHRNPTPAQRDGEIDLFLGAARTDREARGIDAACKNPPPVPGAPTGAAAPVPDTVAGSVAAPAAR